VKVDACRNWLRHFRGADYRFASLSTTLLPSLLVLFAACLGIAQGCAQNPDRGARLHPPAKLSAVLHAGKIRLSWNATDSTQDADYILYRSYAVDGNKEKLATTKSVQYEIPFDSSRAEQFFCVTASLNGAAESACSNVVRIERPAAPH